VNISSLTMTHSCLGYEIVYELQRRRVESIHLLDLLRTLGYIVAFLLSQRPSWEKIEGFARPQPI
jgi:hypothetical protein